MGGTVRLPVQSHYIFEKDWYEWQKTALACRTDFGAMEGNARPPVSVFLLFSVDKVNTTVRIWQTSKHSNWPYRKLYKKNARLRRYPQSGVEKPCIFYSKKFFVKFSAKWNIFCLLFAWYLQGQVCPEQSREKSKGCASGWVARPGILPNISKEEKRSSFTRRSRHGTSTPTRMNRTSRETNTPPFRSSNTEKRIFAPWMDTFQTANSGFR